MKRCAVCWVDPATKRRGTNATTWICGRCWKSPANSGWRVTPTEEVYGVDDSTTESLPAMEWPRTKDPYATVKCIQIMRWYCLGMTQRQIAKKVPAPLKYVSKTIKYWLNNRRYFIENLIAHLRQTSGLLA